MSEDAPKKPGRFAEIRQAYSAIRSIDTQLGWWMLGAAVATLAVAVAIGFAFGHPLYAAFVGLPLALLAATLVMNRRGNRAMYGAIEGQPGATGAALMGVGKRGWYASEKPVAMEMARGAKTTDMTGSAFVFRAIGRPGIVLLGEGPRAKVDRLLKAEKSKLDKVTPGVPVTVWVIGEGEGEVPLRKISNKLTRLGATRTLSKAEVSTVNKRLTSLGGVRPPVPAGMDPRQTRANRKALRGR